MQHQIHQQQQIQQQQQLNHQQHEEKSIIVRFIENYKKYVTIYFARFFKDLVIKLLRNQLFSRNFRLS